MWAVRFACVHRASDLCFIIRCFPPVCRSYDPLKRPDFEQICKRLSEMKAKDIEVHTKLTVAPFAGLPSN
jgi:hypothetical protein